MQAHALTEKGEPVEEVQAVLSLAADCYLRAGSDWDKAAVACLIGSMSDPRGIPRTISEDHHDWIDPEAET